MLKPEKIGRSILAVAVVLVLLAGCRLLYPDYGNTHFAVFAVWAVMFSVILCYGDLMIRRIPSLQNPDSAGFLWLSAAVFFVLQIFGILICVREVFLYDEAYTIGMIRNGYAGIVEITSQDVHSPFYYVVLKAFNDIFGTDQLMAPKFFSMIWLDACLLLGHGVIRRRYSNRVAFFWMVLCSFSPAFVVQASSPRMYTMGLFFVTASIFAILRFCREETLKNWILMTVLSICGVYVHTFTLIELFVMYAGLVIWLLIKKRFRTTGRILGAGAVISAAYLPWLVVLYHQFMRWSGEEAGWSNTIPDYDLSFVWIFLKEWFSFSEIPSTLQVVVGICLFLLLGVLGILYCKKHGDFVPALGTTLCAVVLFIAVMISVFIVPCFLGRYLFPLFALVCLLMAVGMEQLGRWNIVAALLFIIMLNGAVRMEGEYKLDDETGMKQYLEFISTLDHDQDIIMSETYFMQTFNIYDQDAVYLQYGYNPPCMPFSGVETFCTWEDLDGVRDVYMIRFTGIGEGELGEHMTVVDNISFPYSVYNVSVDHYVWKEDRIEEE